MPPVMKQRKAGKVARRLSLNIGLLCSKTFDDAIFEELFEAKYGLKKSDMKKMNIKGVFQIWMNNGDYHEVPLKECHAWTREGCKLCPDFAAEHADISTGGIGKFNDWTLTIVRTDVGRELMDGMIRDGWLETRPGDDDPDAIALMHKLSIKSRKRWPEFAIEAPRLLPPKPASGELSARAHAGGRDGRRISWTARASRPPSPTSRSPPDPAACSDADVVVVDLARHSDVVAAVRAAAPSARIVAFGPHVDDELLAARTGGRRRRRARPLAVLPRSGGGAAAGDLTDSGPCPTTRSTSPTPTCCSRPPASVRKRLDLDRPVPREVILECIRLAVQAPTASNGQTLALDGRDRSRRSAPRSPSSTAAPRGRTWRRARRGEMGSDAQTIRVYKSALYLLDVLARVPVHVIPCIEGRVDARGQHLGRELLRIDHAGELELHARAARPRPRIGLDHAAPPARGGGRRAARHPVRVGEPDRAAPRRVHGRHRLQARGRRAPVEEITYWDEWGATS